MQVQAFFDPARTVCRRRIKMTSCVSRLALLLVALVATPVALANGIGGNDSWQFKTSADMVNQAVVKDMMLKRQNGYYAAPVYTTNIGRQYNCNIAASATGNQSANSAIANSPSTSGASSSALGNQNSSGLDSYGGSASSSQGNSGSVGANVNGNTTTQLDGSASQGIHSGQTNSGAQNASVGGSSACLFGALN
jgi:hypothetical protein